MTANCPKGTKARPIKAQRVHKKLVQSKFLLFYLMQSDFRSLSGYIILKTGGNIRGFYFVILVLD